MTTKHLLKINPTNINCISMVNIILSFHTNQLLPQYNSRLAVLAGKLSNSKAHEQKEFYQIHKKISTGKIRSLLLHNGQIVQITYFLSVMTSPYLPPAIMHN